MELRCAVQQYAWGKYGRNSEVALLNSSGDPDFLISNSMPYAELWMGTHPNGPSVLKGSSQKLGDWIKVHPESLGDKVVEKFGVQLPFLFKVLSVNQALSIQAHPEKVHAEKLHKERPDLYKDPNHKPELAIALTPFEALCGFRPIEEIKHYLDEVPELKAVVGHDLVNELLVSDEAGMHQALKNCFRALMTCPEETVEVHLMTLMTRLTSLDESSMVDQITTLLRRLYTSYPKDVGCFVVYFMNYITLKPGEALYLGPNEPHAYLYGDCIECMACSDNVVRAGLTPKYKDVETLCNMLTYICEPVAAKYFQSIAEDECTVIFRPPVPDFAVAKINIEAEATNYTLIPRNSATVIIVIQGKGRSDNLMLERGTIVFLPASEKFSVRHCLDHLLMFQAMCNI